MKRVYRIPCPHVHTKIFEVADKDTQNENISRHVSTGAGLWLWSINIGYTKLGLFSPKSDPPGPQPTSQNVGPVSVKKYFYIFLNEGMRR